MIQRAWRSWSGVGNTIPYLEDVSESTFPLICKDMSRFLEFLGSNLWTFKRITRVCPAGMEAFSSRDFSFYKTMHIFVIVLIVLFMWRFFDSLISRKLLFKRTFFFSVFIILSFGLACSKDDSFDEGIPTPVSIFTKANGLNEKKGEFDVCPEDIEKYIHFKKLIAESCGDTLFVTGIEPYYAVNGELSSYFVNYNHGCEIIAADKRSVPIIVSSDEQTLALDQMPLAAREWLSDLNEAIGVGKRIKNRSLSSTEETNVQFWSFILGETSGGLRAFDVPPGYPPGHWELVEVQCEPSIDLIDHLIPVEWGQLQPYNTYCPLIAQQFGTYRSPAGCVAVAGAQLFYYFHNTLGTPATAPSTGTVSGYVYPNGDYTQDFGSSSSTVWNQMSSQPSTAALLIGSVGKAIGMQYACYIEYSGNQIINVASGASTSNLIALAANSYGLQSSNRSITQESDSTYVIESLRVGSPVLVSASVLNDPYSSHTFIIDAYKQVRNKYTSVYEYIFRDPEVGANYLTPFEIVISYSYPTRSFAMNWGWEGQYDNFWYSISGVWDPGGVSFNGTRTMYYNFHATS